MKTYGLIGYPVKHSLSPIMQNAAFKDLGIDAEYKLFEIRPEELGDFFSTFKENVCGINITIPHKETSVKYMDRLDDNARSIGAINTVVLDSSKLIGYNTDATGFVSSLKSDLKFDPASKKAFIFGAGGAARAVTFGLLREKVKRIVVTDLDMAKAAGLVGDLKAAGCDAIALKNDRGAERELILDSDLLVNATPCGMKKGDRELLPSEFLHKGLSVFDLIYSPSQTPLIKDAGKRGIRAVNGLGMLIYQGAAAFKLWTKKEPPVGVMRKALESV